MTSFILYWLNFSHHSSFTWRRFYLLTGSIFACYAFWSLISRGNAKKRSTEVSISKLIFIVGCWFTCTVIDSNKHKIILNVIALRIMITTFNNFQCKQWTEVWTGKITKIGSCKLREKPQIHKNKLPHNKMMTSILSLNFGHPLESNSPTRGDGWNLG